LHRLQRRYLEPEFHPALTNPHRLLLHRPESVSVTVLGSYARHLVQRVM
jgi:hypothetical protein